MALIRKKSINVLKHLRKNVDDLEQIAKLEELDIAKANAEIERLSANIAEHNIEATLALKVASNIRALLGDE